MPTPILELVCRAFGDSRLKDCPDEQLLRRFVAERDASAFEALVRRHGAMVLDVCRGLLPDESDAEDAFQATFLILAQKAASVRKARSLASWLHGVAARVARRAQTAFARRRKHERHTPERAAATRADDLTWAEVRAVLHEELNALPDRLRGPLVLCYLEGMGQDEAATELGLPKGTLKGRLERGRELLRARLVQRGLGPAAVLLASAWPVASVSAALTDSAVKVATSAASAPTAPVNVLAGEVLRAMSLTKFRTAFIVVAVALGAGIGAFAFHSPAAPPKGEERDATEHAGRAPARPEPKKLQWQEGPATIPKQPGPVYGVAFDPTGKTLAVTTIKTLIGGEVKGEVTVYDLTNGKELGILPGFHPVAFSPDGKMLAAREGDNVVRVWDVGKWRPNTALKGLSDTVLCLAFSADGKSLVAGSGNPSKPESPGLARLWDLENGTERATHVHAGQVLAVAFAPDGKTVLSASGGKATIVKAWDVSGREAGIAGPGRPFGGVAFSPDGKTVANGIDPIGDTSEMDVKVWDRATGKELTKPLHHPEYTRALAFSPDGKTLAAASSSRERDEKRTGVVRLWDVATGKETTVLRGHKGEVECVTFDRTGRRLATGGADGTVLLWELTEPVDENDELWVKSEDGVLALRASTFVKAAAPGEPIELVVRLRNLSDKPVNVLRPFGVPSVAMFGVEVRGADGKLTYRGDPPKYTVPPEAFVRLKPGEAIRDSWKIDPRAFTGLEKPGRYTITFAYEYKGLWDEFAEKAKLARPWRGKIAGKGIPIEVRGAEEDGTWVKSEDGKLALRLATVAKEVRADKPIELAASLKNLTDKPINVLRPFGDSYKARSSGTTLQGPRGAIRYSGPTPEYTLGSDAFVTLKPGETVTDQLALHTYHREGSDRPGNYRVTFTYRADEGDRTTAKAHKFEDVWVGQIKSETVLVKKVDAKPDDALVPPTGAPLEKVKAVFDPADERIKAFVAELERSGVKLTPEKESKSGRWRVVEPKIAGGTVFVTLCTFSAAATERQMREALDDFSWGWQFKNTHSRLAMGLGDALTEGFEKGVPDEVSALHEDLRVRFFWHKRDQRPAEPLTNEALNTGHDPKDERIRALVTHLGRNGIDLISNGSGEWRITEPAHADGQLIVHIRSFPVPATEWQMRWALATTNLAYQLNPEAHLAMSYVGLRGAEKGKTPAVKALEGKLLRLFREYEPKTLAGHIAAGELDAAGVKEVNGLWEHFKRQKIELAYVENSTNYIQYLFAVGPDRDKRLCVGLGYMPPARAEKMKERYADAKIPHVVRGNLVLFKVGAPDGNTKEFAAAWEKVEAAFKEYPGPAKEPGK